MKRKPKIPKSLQPILWSYRFSSLDPQRHKETIIMQIVNHGGWKHWVWMVRHYGRNEVKRVIEKLPITTFGPRSLKLISLLLDIKRFNYAPRGAKPRHKRNMPGAGRF